MKIKVNYRTGNSFGSQDEEAILEMDWDDLDIAKENLGRIKEHYLWYEWENEASYFKDPKDKVARPAWHTLKYDGLIILKLDDGAEFQMSAFWCGYFETLYGAEIINIENDMSFSLRGW